jgi:uncharacterized SAM-binding protein YcdF (DUF218 family)
MVNTKPKQAFLLLAGFLLMIFVAISCNNNTEKKEEAPPAKAVDSPDTSKMDTATTRPAKTTN